MKSFCLKSQRLLFTLLLLCSSAMLIAQDMFDYTLIGDHPRLFMRANDFTNLEKQISKSPEIKTIHDIILNKCDKVGGSKVEKNFKIIKENLDLAKDDNMIMFSSLNKKGRDDVLKLIESLLVETI